MITFNNSIVQTRRFHSINFSFDKFLIYLDQHGLNLKKKKTVGNPLVIYGSSITYTN